jgi:hypothetical protein
MDISTNLVKVMQQIQYVTDDITMLFNLLQTTQHPKFNYLDYSYADDKLTFTALPSNAGVVGSVARWTSESRSKVTLGKILNTVAPKISENAKRQFIELITARVKSNFQDLKLEVVEGEGIRDAYLTDNYIETVGPETNLHGSCMAASIYQHNLDFYVYNPETIKLLVVRYSDNKVAGRALLMSAYQSLDDLKNDVNKQQLLGRMYFAKTSAKALMTEWATKNTSFRLEKQTSIAHDGTRTDRKWAIPVKHYDLNYYPYMDHFAYIYRELVPNVGVWTNNGGWTSKSPYIVPGRDAFTDSVGHRPPRPDPFRPGQAWMYDEKKWVDEKLVTLVGTKYLYTKDLVKCEVCDLMDTTMAMRKTYDNKRACSAHELVMVRAGTALKSETAVCGACTRPQLRSEIDSGVCQACINKIKPCDHCKTRVDSNFLFKIHTDEMICPTCVDKYLLCDDCWKLCLNVKKYEAKYYCEPCAGKNNVLDLTKVTKKAAKKSTEESVNAGEVVLEPDDIPVSSNAIKIITS